MAHRTGRRRRRKGVTPVVAVVLLVFITVAAAGGAFVFMQEIQDEFKSQFTDQYRVEVSVDTITCDNEDVNVTMTNTGDKEITLNPVNMWVIEKDTGQENLTLSRTTFDLSQNSTSGTIQDPDSTGSYHTHTAGASQLQSGRDYVIEYEFIEHEHTARARCTA